MQNVSCRKILFVITKSNWGGAQRYVYDLATNLPKGEFEVKVLFGGTGEADAPQGALAANVAGAGIQGLYVKEFMRNISIWRECVVLITLFNLFRREKPDIVHLNSSKAGGVGALAARFADVKNIVFTVHGWPFMEDRTFLSKTFIWLASWMTALLCHNVICVSKHDAAIARKMPFIQRKVTLIHNGIGPMSFGSGEKVRSAFPPGVKIIGTVGELTHNKNQISLIERAKRDSSLYVAIVGSGEDYPILERKIKEYGLENRVKLFGFMRAEEALPGFDAFALPSRKEGLPYVLLEAKMAGLPIEANRVGGVSDILDARDMNDFSLETMLTKTITLYNRR